MMATIRQFIIEDVRCFAGRQLFDIRPLTLLVGENSTGKSTMLGCYHTLLNAITEQRLDFNADPYQMGAFDNIVRRTTREAPDSFTLGYSMEADGKETKLLYHFRARGSEPIVNTIEFLFSDGGKVVFANGDSKEAETPLPVNFNVGRSDDNTFTVTLFNGNPMSSQPQLLTYTQVYGVFFQLMWMEQVRSSKEEYRPAEIHNDLLTFFMTHFNEINHCFFTSQRYDLAGRITNAMSGGKVPPIPMNGDQTASDLGKIVSLAPIRAKPKRTYDPLAEVETPEGNEAPMYLMRLSKTEPDKWRELQQRLQAFGQASGLFDGIFVRNLSSSMNDPFQLEVKIRGRKSNIKDVGYGIGQLLPIAVRILQNDERQTFLLQQPEVHLHPSGRAALASLLVQSVKRNKHFLVETHSDYLIDRTSICIRKGEIAADDVSLIYFEPKGNRGVKVHNMRFDDTGNLLNVPVGYRAFFMEESDRFLGFDEA